MTDVSAAVAKSVRLRAADRCEYCLTHQSLQVATFHIEHVIPAASGGATSSENLALACPTCNLHKSSRLTALDPLSNDLVPLFNPRVQSWADHFEFQEFEVIGKTAVGRATIAALQLNHPRRIQVRKAEQAFHLFPP